MLVVEYRLPRRETLEDLLISIRTVHLILIPCISNHGVEVEAVASTNLEVMVVLLVVVVKIIMEAVLNLQDLLPLILTNKVQEYRELLVEMENVILLMLIMLVVAVVLVKRVTMPVLSVEELVVMDFQLL